MSHHRPNTISWTLVFSQKKILLKSGDILYYVRLPRTQKDYLHGDRVRARLTKKWDGSQLAEVEILALEVRTTEQLLARVISRNNKRYISVLRDFGYYESSLVPIPSDAHEDDIFLVRFTREGKMIIVNKFAGAESFDIEERVLFFTAGISMDFPRSVEEEAQRYSREKWETIAHTIKKRRDFRGECVWTIDWADAKDLDDAISVSMDTRWRYILGVHIADVAEYVREDSQLDREALLRATSVYTPGKVIPMLPEALSNDVCSLHPGEPKLVLSCIMTVNQQGIVEHTELVEGIIESVHRGVYEEIQSNYEWRVKSEEWRDCTFCHSEWNGGIPLPSTYEKYPISQSKDEIERDPYGMTKKETHKNQSLQPLSKAISLSYNLYEILKKRRQKEWKILFESAEVVFDFPASLTGEDQGGFAQTIVPESIRTRSRVGAHMLIEEFMVLANEEVAKWCDGHALPFLSRVHGLPPYNSMEIIKQILSKWRGSEFCHSDNGGICSTKKNTGADDIYRQHDRNQKNTQKSLEPRHIRAFLDTLPPEDVYKYSRLLLPKMAKATYADAKHRHFGLALEYYAHFTSPIRRYPDLQVHRIIKEKLRGTLTPERIIHYKKILKKVARSCSERERAAEDIERAFDSLYAVRYMANHVGETYTGRVSGIAEFAYFVELDSGIEVTVYLPRYSRYIVDSVTGILASVRGQRVAQIWEKIQITITGVMKDERRILGEKI